MWRDICYLCSETPTLDSKNRPKRSLVDRKVFCNKKSVGSKEFYQASQQGIKPVLVLEVHTFEYKGETHIKFESKTYRLIRSYDKTDEIVELVCEALVNEQ